MSASTSALRVPILPERHAEVSAVLKEIRAWESVFVPAAEAVDEPSVAVVFAKL